MTIDDIEVNQPGTTPIDELEAFFSAVCIAAVSTKSAHPLQRRREPARIGGRAV